MGLIHFPSYLFIQQQRTLVEDREANLEFFKSRKEIKMHAINTSIVTGILLLSGTESSL